LTTNRHGLYLFGARDNEFEPDRSNERYCRTLCQCWIEPEFIELMVKVKGSLGSHINHKVPATWCAGNDSSDPEGEIRGRWKGTNNKRFDNRYNNVYQLLKEAKLAGILSVGGPVRYKLRADSHASNSFLYGMVTPKMHEHFCADQSNIIVYVLGLRLLWEFHDPTLAHMIDPEVRLRIQQRYNSIRSANTATYEPVTKVTLHISCVEN
jgi:hypothetical protein